jgi:hypothetical protein
MTDVMRSRALYRSSPSLHDPQGWAASSSIADLQAPQDNTAQERTAAPKSQRGTIVIAGGLVTTGVALAVLAAGILLGGMTHSHAAGHLTRKSPQPTEKTSQVSEGYLSPGDCLIGSNLGLGTENTWPATATTVACTQPHLAEVFYVGHPWLESQATYPGYDAILKVTAERCGAAFAAYDGIPLSQSKFIYHSVAPTPASDWAAGDREVVCMAFDPNQLPPLNYSIKGKYQ